MATTITKRVTYSGRVQGVGFRATSLKLAADLPVRGFVRNLLDGRVELVAEGTEEGVQTLLYRIQERLGALIEGQVEEDAPAQGFRDFEIRR